MLLPAPVFLCPKFPSSSSNDPSAGQRRFSRGWFPRGGLFGTHPRTGKTPLFSRDKSPSLVPARLENPVKLSVESELRLSEIVS